MKQIAMCCGLLVWVFGQTVADLLAERLKLIVPPRDADSPYGSGAVRGNRRKHASDGVSIFDAFEQQLGLRKLEDTKEPFDAVVVDHIEKPTQD
jgi:uncharacterized protein (TIGR03435 family)